MKRNSTAFVAAVTLLLFCQACKEVGPNVDLGTVQNLNDTTYLLSNIQTPQTKNVLIEEFTGVKCANCPTGHQLVKDLKNTYPDKVIGIALHSNFLGSPYTGSPDLRNAKAEDLISSTNYGPLSEKPTAIIDRTYNAAISSYLQGKNLWANAVAAQISKTTPVNIAITKAFDDNTRELKVQIVAQFTDAVAENCRLVVALTEDSIVAEQLQPDGSTHDPNYIHLEVLRDFLTANVGNSFGTPGDKGRVFIRNFTTTLNSSWKEKHMHIVAYIQKNTTSKEVLQTIEEKVK